MPSYDQSGPAELTAPAERPSQHQQTCKGEHTIAAPAVV